MSGGWTMSRCYRLAVAALLSFIVWQVVSYFWLQRGGGGPPFEGQQITGRRVPDGPPAYDAPGAETVPPSVEVEVFYEALCPDSMNFVVDQLAPTVYQLKDAIRLLLVPYGKAKTHYESRPERRAGDPPPVTFTCQHGPEECWANKVHACGIRHAGSQRQAVEFVTCLMRHFRKVRHDVEQCASSSGLQWSQLSTCVEDAAINADMERYGNLTHNLRPAIEFIPTMTIDGSQANQSQMFEQFATLVCNAYQARFGRKADGC